MSANEFDVDLSARDVVILKTRIEHPTASVRKLRDILEERYDISLSHNRVNEILREMEAESVFRKTVIQNENLFEYYLFRIAFHYPNFEQRWEECYWDLVEDPHVMMFFNADGYYRWQLIVQFTDSEQSEQWLHDFFKRHGSLIAQFDNTKLPSVHKFRTDADVFDELLRQTEQGRKYLDVEPAPAEDPGGIAADGGDSGSGASE